MKKVVVKGVISDNNNNNMFIIFFNKYNLICCFIWGENCEMLKIEKSFWDVHFPKGLLNTLAAAPGKLPMVCTPVAKAPGVAAITFPVVLTPS